MVPKRTLSFQVPSDIFDKLHTRVEKKQTTISKYLRTIVMKELALGEPESPASGLSAQAAAVIEQCWRLPIKTVFRIFYPEDYGSITSFDPRSDRVKKFLKSKGWKFNIITNLWEAPKQPDEWTKEDQKALIDKYLKQATQQSVAPVDWSKYPLECKEIQVLLSYCFQIPTLYINYIFFPDKSANDLKRLAPRDPGKVQMGDFLRSCGWKRSTYVGPEGSCIGCWRGPKPKGWTSALQRQVIFDYLEAQHSAHRHTLDLQYAYVEKPRPSTPPAQGRGRHQRRHEILNPDSDPPNLG